MKHYILVGFKVTENITYFINFTSIKFFTLTLVAVVNNFAPLITVVFAYFMLSERI